MDRLRWQALVVPPSHSPGVEVLIGDGPFIGRIASIAEVNGDTAIVKLTVFDRVVPLEMSRSQLSPPPDSGGGIRDPRGPSEPSGNPGSIAELE
jgi:hypothetical protein